MHGVSWRAVVVGVAAVALAVAGAGCRGGGGGPSAPTTPRPPEVVALIAKLNARDARIRTLYVEGTITVGTHAPRACWWAKDGERYASGKAGPPYPERFVHAGGERVRFAGTAVMERSPVETGEFPLEPTLPIEFGLGTISASWATFLAWSPRVVVLGRETVGGRDCLKVAAEQVPGLGAGWTNPVVAWFDDQGTGLAMRFAFLVRPGELARAGVTPAAEANRIVDLGDEIRVGFQIFDLLELRELAPGVAIGGRVHVSTPLLGSAPGWTTQVTEVRLGGPVDPALFAVPAKAPSRAEQRRRGAWVAVGGLLACLVGWTVLYRRRRRGDPPWPGAEDPEVARGLRAIRKLAYLAPIVVVGDLVQKLTMAVPLLALDVSLWFGEGLVVRAAICASLAVGEGLVIVGGLRLDRALRGAPDRAPAAAGLLAIGGVVGGMAWIALAGVSLADNLATWRLGPPPWEFVLAYGGTLALQFPLLILGLLAAAWWARIARAAGR